MASASIAVSKDHILCSICMDVFTDLVDTPCGHSYCRACIAKDHVSTSLWGAVSQLEMMKQVSDVKLKSIQKYAVDITLDPDTAHPTLILSEDGKQVIHGSVWKNLPENTERFLHWASISVLGKQSFSSGRFYYEVQVRGTPDWNLGVVRESINRNIWPTMTPINGYWTIQLRYGAEYSAAACSTLFPLLVREDLQKVGVFVDYEEGLVSFYDVKTRVHLYSYTCCTFTEKLYPFFHPYCKHYGINSAPLIISPVSMNTGLGEDGERYGLL